VIVTEKCPISRAALAALLSWDGYRVFQAADARSAITHLKNVADVKVVLADLDMPEWRSIVRHATATTDALLIGLVGNVPFWKVHDLKQEGIRLCLQKPLSYADVVVAMEENIQPSGDEAHHRKAA
jgi:DNA-binding NtrC family response regulator